LPPYLLDADTVRVRGVSRSPSGHAVVQVRLPSGACVQEHLSVTSSTSTSTLNRRLVLELGTGDWSYRTWSIVSNARAGANQVQSRRWLVAAHDPLHAAVVRTALNDDLKWGIVSRNVATLINLPRALRNDSRTLDGRSAKAFLVAAKSNRVETA
jgi:hypothetical protein